MSREVSWHMPDHQIAITDKTIDVWECMVRLIAAPLQFSGFTFLTLTIYLGPAVSHEVIPPTACLSLATRQGFICAILELLLCFLVLCSAM